MDYYKEIDFIPSIPNDLIDDIDIIETYENVFADPSYSHTYASYKVSKELEDWIQQFFDYPVVTRYQVIKKKLNVHIDIGITGIKYNYIVTSGGDNVKTRWWNSVENPKDILHEETIKTNLWHAIQIDLPHDITEVSSPRVSVVVRKK